MIKELYKVIIVDDEFLIRELVEERVNWKELDCEIVLKATSALEVLDYIDEYSVDIVIADINMPVIDGLALSEKIKQLNKRIKIIMLTGYDEFSYAKRGIDIGVDGYLLKPIDGDVIKEEVTKIIGIIEDEIGQQKAYEQALKRLQVDKPYIKDRFLLDYILGFIDNDKLENRWRYFDINSRSKNYQLGIIEICPENEGLDNIGENYELLYKWKNVLCELIEANVFSDMNRRIFLLSDDEEGVSSDDLNYIIKSVVDQRYNVKIGISSVKSSLYEYNEMLNEATDALNFSVIKGMNKVCMYDEIGVDAQVSYETMGDSEVLFTQILDKLKLYIRSGVKKEAMIAIDELFKVIESNIDNASGEKLNMLRAEMSSVISYFQQIVYSHTTQVQKQIEEELKKTNLQIYVDLNTIESLPRAKSLVENYVGAILSCTEKMNTKKSNDIIDKINTYIDKNYCNSELTLKNTAATFYINPDYLSRIYKKKMGISFKDKVFKLRMEKAIQLIKETDLRGYEIGEKIGIIDANYLSVCFKKYMNMSISEYKRKLNS
ncbi:response regulator transcription factor [Vallitalea okinawensis]|uniref:response regulator transcription factor n=1 Tax=Vallitalea okinawensis TaxID=2078660 RepID=UPI000CFC1753|nr:response regulator [Vallitalea okinawensis]